MIRTLTLVSVLALAAGLAMGFFVAEARVKPAPSTSSMPSNPALEAKVLAYVKAYDLDPDDVLPGALLAVRGLVEDGLLVLDSDVW